MCLWELHSVIFQTLVIKYFKIISLFLSKLFVEKRLVKSVKVLPLSIKSINPIQKYPHITESYACILKNICYNYRFIN